MGKIKTLVVSAAAVACPLLAKSSTAAGEYICSAAAFCAGSAVALPAQAETLQETADAAPVIAEPTEEAVFVYGNNTEEAEQTAPPEPPASDEPQETEEAAQPCGVVISRNISGFTEEEQESGVAGGSIERVFYGSSAADDHITLPAGGQVRNLTALPNADLLSAAEQLPRISVELGSAQPQVLIVHTHTTECYEPEIRDSYDSTRPCRTRDSSRNIVAVGEVLAQQLAANGISVLHDGTIHDYPNYTGAYDRSEDTIREALAEFPSIKLIIDLHRDAIERDDGTRIAPAVQINGRSAAQFMIITGCDDGRFGNMPNYMENFKLACLIQQSANSLYAGLARPVLFDYRNYNQHISTGSLLIEVGSHANSLDEAEYTAKLLADIIADAAKKLT